MPQFLDGKVILSPSEYVRLLEKTGKPQEAPKLSRKFKKYTTEELKEIFSRDQAGETPRAIAKVMGRSVQAIRCVLWRTPGVKVLPDNPILHTKNLQP